jgi:hypothetical protein
LEERCCQQKLKEPIVLIDEATRHHFSSDVIAQSIHHSFIEPFDTQSVHHPFQEPFNAQFGCTFTATSHLQYGDAEIQPFNLEDGSAQFTQWANQIYGPFQDTPLIMCQNRDVLEQAFTTSVDDFNNLVEACENDFGFSIENQTCYPHLLYNAPSSSANILSSDGHCITARQTFQDFINTKELLSRPELEDIQEISRQVTTGSNQNTVVNASQYVLANQASKLSDDPENSQKSTESAMSENDFRNSQAIQNETLGHPPILFVKRHVCQICRAAYVEESRLK